MHMCSYHVLLVAIFLRDRLAVCHPPICLPLYHHNNIVHLVRKPALWHLGISPCGLSCKQAQLRRASIPDMPVGSALWTAYGVGVLVSPLIIREHENNNL